MSGWYRIELLDADECELTVSEERTLREAKRSAIEKTNEPMNHDWRVARVLDAAGVCVWDKRKKLPAACGCCGEDMAPGQTFCCSDDFAEPGDIRETGK